MNRDEDNYWDDNKDEEPSFSLKDFKKWLKNQQKLEEQKNEKETKKKKPKHTS